MNSVDLYGELFVNTENLPKIKWDSPNLFNQIGLDLLKGQNNCKVKITITPEKKLKSHPQLALYKGVLLKYINKYMVDNGTDVSLYETDMYLRICYCFDEVNEIKVPKDLAKISLEDMGLFITKVLEFCNRLDIHIPLNN